MSRTDKDRPYRIRSVDSSLPRHVVHCHVRQDSWSAVPVEHDCDLDQWDQAEHPSSAAPRRHQRCQHVLDWWASPYWWRSGSGAPRWVIHASWNGPERVRVRDDLRNAAKRFNSGDDLDDFDFPNFQHRHEACWWWD